MPFQGLFRFAPCAPRPLTTSVDVATLRVRIDPHKHFVFFWDLVMTSLNTSEVAMKSSSGRRLCGRCADVVIWGVLLITTSMATHLDSPPVAFAVVAVVVHDNSWCTQRSQQFRGVEKDIICATVQVLFGGELLPQCISICE